MVMMMRMMMMMMMMMMMIVVGLIGQGCVQGGKAKLVFLYGLLNTGALLGPPSILRPWGKENCVQQSKASRYTNM
eukprot:2056542-Karenia_brevis.AAC.1